jgi:F-type H+-transporting ATPase subunit delta
MNSTKSASRYAKALLELAIEMNKIDRIAADMRAIVAAKEETSEFQLFLNSPLIQSDKKVSILNQLFDGFDELSLSFIALITKNRREGILAEIAASFDELLKEHQGIVPVTLVSTKKLDEATVNSILARVKPAINGEIELTEKFDESLVGGFIVKIGNTQVDASISNQLKNLKQRLTR